MEAAKKAEREKIEAAERAEIKRQADIKAERERAEREERQRKEAAELAAKETARKEAMKPDIEKVREYGRKIMVVVSDTPAVQSEDAKLLLMAAREHVERVGRKLVGFEG